MSNKDIIGARELGPNAREILKRQYDEAVNDPMAKGGVYTLRKFDGYNPDGSTKYIYKNGYAHDGALERYKNQWVQDGFEIVDEKKFVGAEDWENKWHAVQSNLDERVLDHGMVYDSEGNYVNRDKASGINFGSGKSELYNKDLLGVDVGKTQEDYDRNRLKSQAMQNAFKARPKDSNWIDAAQSSTVSMVADLGDFILDAVTPGNNTLLDDWSDSEYTDKVFGFDSVGQSQLLHEALNNFKNGDILNAGINTAIAAPGLLGQSLPYLVGLGTGTTEAKLAVNVAKAGQRIKKAKDLGKSAETIAKLENRMKKMKGYDKYESYANMPVNMARAKSLLTDKGLMAVHTAMVEEQLDQRVKNKLEAGEDPEMSIPEMSAVWLGMLPFTLLDRVAFLDTVKSGGLNKMLKDAIEIAPASVRNNIYTKAVGNVGKILASGSEEAAQEYLQTWGEIFGANLGVGNQSFADILGKQALQDEALMGAIGGLGAGSLTNALVASPKMAGNAVMGLKQARDQKKLVDNANAIVENLDDTDFDLLMQDWNQIVTDNEEAINNINDIEAFTKNAKSVDNLLESPLENVRNFGESVRELARKIAIQDQTLSDLSGKELGEKMAILEYVDNDGNFQTDSIKEMYDMLGIDPTEPAWSKGTQEERQARNSKAIAQAYNSLSNEDKLNIHKLDSMEGIQNPVLGNNNVYGESNLEAIKKIEEKAFEKNGLIDKQLAQQNKLKSQAKDKIKNQKDKIENYKAAREEAIEEGKAKKIFDQSDIKLDEYEKDPVGFVEKIKAFGRKSKIIERIKGYSDKSLIKAANDKLASKAMIAAIKHVLDTRNKVKSKTAAIERDNDTYETQIDNLQTRYTKEALDNIEKILSEKTYKYAEERDDAIRFVNEAYARGIINSKQREQLVLDIGLKSIGTSDAKEKKSLSERSNKAKMNRDFKAIEKEYIDSQKTDKPMSESEKIKKQNIAILNYSKDALQYAGEENLGKTKQIGKYNKQTFDAIRKYAGMKKIEYTQERDRALAMIDAGLKAGHITQKQADTFRKRIEKISEGAVENPDTKAYEHFKNNIIKTASDLEEQYRLDQEEKAKHEETITDITIKGIMGEELTEADEEAYINAKKSILELEEISKEYIYFTEQEKELHNVIDQIWDIEIIEQTNEEIEEDKAENYISFEFC